MKFYEDGSFAIELQNTDLEKVELKFVAQWLFQRIAEFSSNTLQEISFTDTHVHLHTSYEDFCMGCHMSTINQHWEIPNEVFYSEASASIWLELDKKRKDEAEMKRVQEFARREAALKEKQERQQLANLKAKYPEA